MTPGSFRLRVHRHEQNDNKQKHKNLHKNMTHMDTHDVNSDHTWYLHVQGGAAAQVGGEATLRCTSTKL